MSDGTFITPDDKNIVQLTNFLPGAIKFVEKVRTYGYWTDDSGSLRGAYKNTRSGYPINLDDYYDTYPTYIYDSNSNLYKYVESYKKYFENELNKVNFKMRLITYEELYYDLNCNSTTCATDDNSKRTWLYSFSYWTGTAQNRTNISYVHSMVGLELMVLQLKLVLAFVL